MVVTGLSLQTKLVKEGGVSLKQLIEYVKVPLSFLLINDTGLFQKIILNVASIRGTLCKDGQRL